MLEEYEFTSIRVEMASDATIRDYFAAQAMTALIVDGGYGSRNNDLAKGAYSVADAMLRAREELK